MDFDHPWTFAPAGVDHIVATATTVEKNSAFRKAFVHFGLGEVADRKSRGHNRVSTEGPCSFCAGDGEFFILRGARSTTYADTSDDLSIENNRDSALQWRKERVRQSCHRRTALVDDVFENLSGLLKEDGGARLPNGNIRSGGKSAVETLDRKSVV